MSRTLKQSLRRISRILVLVGFVTSSIVSPTLAGPTGGRVVSGDGSISHNGNTSRIDQTTDRLIIEWDSFDTTAQEQVRFYQPSSDASVLNRVLSGHATTFDGSLFANGNVIIVNGAGIHFGPNARVDVGSLIASTAGISNSNFLNDRLIFDRPGLPDAMVSNEGMITVRDTGLAALVAPGVENSGLIRANLGTVILGAGEAHTIDFSGDGLVAFTITEPTKTAPKRRDGTTAEALVSNSGTVEADGGSIVMTASQASWVLDNAINMSGVAQANSVGVRNGKIVLFGGDKGRVKVGGRVRASGTRTGETGGTIHITGEEIPIPKSRIEALGEAGGGEVLIGGALKGGPLDDDSPIGYLKDGDLVSILTGEDAGAAGNGFMPMADRTVIGAETIIDASSGVGNGGHVIVWGTDEVYFHGTITTLGGDNGFVEISTRGTGIIDGVAHTGNMLIDPEDVCVGNLNTNAICSGSGLVSPTIIDRGLIETTLSGGGTFTINTENAAGAGTGRVLFENLVITVNNDTGSQGTFRIEAADTIDTGNTEFQSNGTNGTNYEFFAGSDLGTMGTPVASADVILRGQPLNTGGGHVIFDAADDIFIGDPLSTSGGDATLIARGGDGRSTITFGFGSSFVSDDFIDTTAGNLAGTVTLQTDELVVNSGIDPFINADGTGGTVTFLRTTVGDVSLGDDNGGLVLSQAILQNIDAESLIIGSPGSDNRIIDILVHNADSTVGTITGLVQLNALAPADSDVFFEGTNLFNALEVRSRDSILVFAGNTSTTGGDIRFEAGFQDNNPDADIFIYTEVDTNGGSFWAQANDDVRIRTVATVATVSTDGGDAHITTLGLGTLSEFEIAERSQLNTVNPAGAAGNVFIQADDIDFGFLTSGERIDAAEGATDDDGTVVIARVTNGDVSLGDLTSGMHISQLELQKIDAAALVIGDASDGSIGDLAGRDNRIRDIFVANADSTTGTITGLVQFNALANANSDVFFDGTNVFHALEARAWDDIRVRNSTGTTSTTGGAIRFEAGFRVNNGDADVLIHADVNTNGGSFSAQADDDVRIRSGATVSTLGGDAHITTLAIGGLSVFEIEDGSQLSTVNPAGPEGNVFIQADDIDFGSGGGERIDAAEGATGDDGTVVIARVTNGDVSLMSVASGMHITQGELASIDAAALIIGDTSDGSIGDLPGRDNRINRIFVRDIDSTVGTITGLVQLNALATAGENGVFFAGTNRFNALEARARDDVSVLGGTTSTPGGDIGFIAGFNTDSLGNADVVIDGTVETDGGDFLAQADDDVVVQAEVNTGANSGAAGHAELRALGVAGDTAEVEISGNGRIETSSSIGIDGDILVVAEDLILETGLDRLVAGGNGGPDGNVTILRSTIGSIGIGNGVGDMVISQAELNTIVTSGIGSTPGALTFGNPDAGDSNTTDINVGSAKFAAFGAVNMNALAASTINYSGSITVKSLNAAAAEINVLTGAYIESETTINFDATTVNLDGNLESMRPGGITGTATTVNVVGDNGEAQLQDAVDIAAAGATVNVGDGTFTGGVQVYKPLTLIGDGFTNTTTMTVPDNDVGMTITSSGVTIDGILFTGDGDPVNATGVLVDGSSGPIDNILIGDANLDSQGNRFAGLTTGLRIQTGVNPLNTVTVEIGLGNVFDTSTDGIVLDGTNTLLTGNTFNNVSFADTITGDYIRLESRGSLTPGIPPVLDATSATFDGVLGSALTVAQAIAVENKIVHYLDDPQLRLINFGSIVASSATLGTSIQRAVNLAGATGVGTVVVPSGTYRGSVEVWVNGLTLIGEGATTIIDTDRVDPFANNGDMDNGFQVAAIDTMPVNPDADPSGAGDVSGVTIDGFAFVGQNIGIELGEAGVNASEASDVMVKNSVFTDLFDGIVANNVTGSTTISSVEMSDIAQNGIRFDSSVDVVRIDGSTISVTPIGGGDAVLFSATLTGAEVTITGNDEIAGGLGIFDNTVGIGFGDVEESTITIISNGEIIGTSGGIGILDITDSIIQIVENAAIVGQGGAGVFTSAMSDGTRLQIVGNTWISGGEDGIGILGRVTDSIIQIAGNELIAGLLDDGIFVRTDLTNTDFTIGTSTVIVDGTARTFGGNDEILGDDNGVSIDDVIGGSFTVANNGLVQGFFENGIVTGLIGENARFAVVGNTEIRGGDGTSQFGDGIAIGYAESSTVTIAGNDGIFGEGYDAIFFFAGVENSDVTIGPATVTVDNQSVLFGGNIVIEGGDDGINVGGIVGGTFTVFQNGGVVNRLRRGISGRAGSGIEFEEVVGNDATVAVWHNLLISGGEEGIEFDGLVIDSEITIEDNDIIAAIENGIHFDKGVLGEATVNIGGDNLVFADKLAININHLQSPSTVSITGGTYSGLGGALLVDNTGVSGPDGRLNLGAAVYVAGAGSMVFEVLTDAGNAGVAVDFTGAARFLGGATGMRFTGPGVSIVGNTLGTIEFTGQTGNFIELTDGALFAPGRPTIIRGNTAMFDGVLIPPTASPALISQVESRIIDFDDDSTLGQIFLLSDPEPLPEPLLTDAESKALAEFLARSTFGVRSTNVQTPGDWILRPEYVFEILARSIFEQRFGLGRCAVVVDAGNPQGLPVCTASESGSDISLWLDRYLSNLDL